jgi:hypothetical protein
MTSFWIILGVFMKNGIQVDVEKMNEKGRTDIIHGIYIKFS